MAPKRADMARFLQWLKRTEDELNGLKKAHSRAITALGGETICQKEIDKLI